MERTTGFEPAVYTLATCRFSQLSYVRIFTRAGNRIRTGAARLGRPADYHRLLPAEIGILFPTKTSSWLRESNPSRPAYHAGALPRRRSQRTIRAIRGSYRTRTGNLSGANRTLSQLELRTLFVESTGFEPVLPQCHRGVLPARRQPHHFVDRPGLEPGSPTCEAGALPN